MWAPLVTIGLLMIFQAKMKTTQPVVKHVGQFSSVIVSWWDYLWKNSVRNIKLERKLPMPVKLILRGNCYNFFGSWLVKQQRVWGFQSMVDVGYDVTFYCHIWVDWFSKYGKWNAWPISNEDDAKIHAQFSYATPKWGCLWIDIEEALYKSYITFYIKLNVYKLSHFKLRAHVAIYFVECIIQISE